jgi:hypothetical protein
MLIEEKVKKMLIREPAQDPEVENDKNCLVDDFIKKYELDDPHYSYMINSFERIGWADPFPKEEQKFSPINE